MEPADEAAKGGVACGICLTDSRRAIRGELDCCAHHFCFVCIMAWARVESRCPFCKARFRSIRRPPVPGRLPHQRIVAVAQRVQVWHPLGNESNLVGADPSANSGCSVCSCTNDEDLLLLCELCDVAAHTYCAGLGTTVPEGDWFCKDCATSKEQHSKCQVDDGSASSSELEGELEIAVEAPSCTEAVTDLSRSTFALEDCFDEVRSCARAVQLLAIRANFRISYINANDWNQKANIYMALEGEVQEEGMDLVLTGPYRMLQAYSSLGLEVFTADDGGPSTDDEAASTDEGSSTDDATGLGLEFFTADDGGPSTDDEAPSTDDEGSSTDEEPSTEDATGLGLEVFTADDEEPSTDDEGPSTRRIFKAWDVTEPDEVEEFTQTIYGGLGRKLEITYLVIPEAVETHVEVRLNLKDLGSRSRAVYGSVKATAIDYGSKTVHLFSCERGKSLSLPCGSTCILPLGPHMIALPYRRHFKLQIEVDLRVITTCDSQEEDKNLEFCLDCSRRIRSEERLERPCRIRSQKREVDGDQVEVNVIWRLEATF